MSDIDALAAALDKVLTLSPAEKKQMEKAARKNAEDNFSVQEMCDQTLQVYKEILK